MGQQLREGARRERRAHLVSRVSYCFSHSFQLSLYKRERETLGDAGKWDPVSEALPAEIEQLLANASALGVGVNAYVYPVLRARGVPRKRERQCVCVCSTRALCGTFSLSL